MIGQTLAHYQITDKLGAGGMGEIYKARDTRLNRFVALKVLPSEKVADPERRRRFLQEAQASSSLNHPNIVILYDILEVEGTICLVLELVEGRTLSEMIPRGGLPVEHTLQYAAQITAALACAHEAGIVHRDLKPANVMITDAGLVKILDFGLAKLTQSFSGEVDDQTMSRMSLTMEGSILGTVNYMSPEQAEGRPVDQRSDIFSFGVVLYEMVTGARAFEASTILSTLTKVLRDDPQPLLELSPTAPLDLAGIIARCIRKNPAERYQSMREVHQGLAAVRLERQAAATRDAVTVLDAIPPVIVTPPPPVSSRGWKPMVWVGGLLAIPLLALGIFIGTRIARSPAPAAVESVPRTTPPERPRVGDSGKPSPSVAPDAPKAEPDSPPAPPAATATPAVRQVKLMDGTPVRLALDEAVERTVDIGVVVKLHVVSDVTADGAVVIAKGAEASGVVVESGKKTLLRRRPKVTMRLQRVRLVDGKSASLRPTAERRTEGMVVDTAGGADHLVKPGEGAVAGKGTEYWSYVDGDVVLVMEEK